MASVASLDLDIMKFPKLFHFYSVISGARVMLLPLGKLMWVLSLVQMVGTGLLPIYNYLRETGKYSTLAHIFLLCTTFSTSADPLKEELLSIPVLCFCVVVIMVSLFVSYRSFGSTYRIFPLIIQTRAWMLVFPVTVAMIPLLFILIMKEPNEDSENGILTQSTFVIVFVLIYCILALLVMDPIILGNPIFGNGHISSRIVPDRLFSKMQLTSMFMFAVGLIGKTNVAMQGYVSMAICYALYWTGQIWSYPVGSALDTAFYITFAIMHGVIPTLSLIRLSIDNIYLSDKSVLMSILALTVVSFWIVYRLETTRRARLSKRLSEDKFDDIARSKKELMLLCQVAVSDDRVTDKLIRMVAEYTEKTNDPDITLIAALLMMKHKNNPPPEFVRCLSKLLNMNSRRMSFRFAIYQIVKMFTWKNECLAELPLHDDFDERIKQHAIRRDEFWKCVIEGKICDAETVNVELTNHFMEMKFDYNVFKSFYGTHSRLNSLNRSFFYDEFSVFEEDPMLAIKGRMKHAAVWTDMGTSGLWTITITCLVFILMGLMFLPLFSLKQKRDYMALIPRIITTSTETMINWVKLADVALNIVGDTEGVWMDDSKIRELREQTSIIDKETARLLEKLTMIASGYAGFSESNQSPWFMITMNYRPYLIEEDHNIPIQMYVRSYVHKIYHEVERDAPLTCRDWSVLDFVHANNVLDSVNQCLDRWTKNIPDVSNERSYHLMFYVVYGTIYSGIAICVTRMISWKSMQKMRNKRPRKHPNPEYADVQYSDTAEGVKWNILLIRGVMVTVLYVVSIISQATIFYYRTKSHTTRLGNECMTIVRLNEYIIRILKFWLATKELQVFPEMKEYVDLRQLQADIIATDHNMRLLEGPEITLLTEFATLNISKDVINNENASAIDMMRYFTLLEPSDYENDQKTLNDIDSVARMFFNVWQEVEVVVRDRAWVTMTDITWYYRIELVILATAVFMQYFLCSWIILTIPWRLETLFHHVLSLSPRFIASDPALMEIAVSASEKDQSNQTEISSLLSLFEASDIHLIVIDEHATITGFTRPVQTLFGYKYDQLIRQNIEVLIPKTSRDNIDNISSFYNKLHEGGTIVAQRLIGRSSDNISIPISARISHINSITLLELQSTAEEIKNRELIHSYSERISNLRSSLLPSNHLPEIITSNKPSRKTFKEGTLVYIGSVESVKKEILEYSLARICKLSNSFIIEANSSHVIVLFCYDLDSVESHVQRALNYIVAFSMLSKKGVLGVALTLDAPELIVFPLPEINSTNPTLEECAACVPSTTVELMTPGLGQLMEATKHCVIGHLLADDQIVDSLPNVLVTDTDKAFAPRMVRIDQIPYSERL